jgi:hypothetical protein
MRLFWPLAALALIAATDAHAAQSDALKAGKLQCYMPNTAKHTCTAISGYIFGKTVVNRAEVLLSPSPLVTMKGDSAVTFKGETICGTVAKSDIDHAAILANGNPLPEDQAVQVRANIWAVFAPRAGKEVCTSYAPAADGGYSAISTLDGQPDATVPPAAVILVDPKDGYTVGAP